MTDTLSGLSAQVATAETRPEIQLLLCCARTDVNSEQAAQIRSLLHGDVDWTYLIRIALQHRVMPLLYWNLHATCPEAVPETILNQLQRRFYANTMHNLLLVRELLTLLSMLEERGVPAIPYKGPVLAASAYRNIALRQFGDLDILIREQDAVRAKDLLLSQGYRLQYQPPVAYETLFRRFRQTYDLMREDGQIFVELHWNIISWPTFFPPNSAFLWECPEVVFLANTPVRNLAPEDVLPVLCVPGAKYYWERLGWICDIAELIRMYPGIDWKGMMERASRLGSVRMLYLGLLLAQSLLGAAVPEDILRQVKGDRVVPSVAARVRLRLFGGGNGLLGAVERHAFYLKLGEDMRDKVRCAIHLVYRMIARVVYYVIGPRIWRPE
jgi:Uncharacterised nucleotidyltransferase